MDKALFVWRHLKSCNFYQAKLGNLQQWVRVSLYALVMRSRATSKQKNIVTIITPAMRWWKNSEIVATNNFYTGQFKLWHIQQLRFRVNQWIITQKYATLLWSPELSFSYLIQFHVSPQETLLLMGILHFCSECSQRILPLHHTQPRWRVCFKKAGNNWDIVIHLNLKKIYTFLSTEEKERRVHVV